MKKNFKYGLLLLALCLQIPAYAYNEEKINTLAQVYATKSSSWDVYTVGSFTKTFTTTLAARAVVEKKLNLNDPFIHYFSELRQNSNLKSITLIDRLVFYSS